MQAANPPSAFRLGIDFGTSHTTAILRWPDGHARPLLFDGSPLLPSAVYAEPGGHLLVGRDAIHAARLDPARFEPTPKRRVAEGEATTVQLGDQTVEVTAMIAAVLARVKDEAVRVSGVLPAALDVTVTHPAAWSPDRTSKLVSAATRAGLPAPRLVAEPVAAAGYFSAVLGRTISPGSALVVYDFGGGTFDASVVSPAEYGYVVLAVDGLPDVGGVDLDAALFRHVADAHRAEDPEIWQRLEKPQTAADRRHRRHLIEDIRTAKEMLSRAESAAVPLPLLEREARITRAEFEVLARPILERTVRATVDVVAAANLQPGRIAAVLLVGGSSRIPLVARLLREQTKLEPATMDQPETVVAEGSVRLATGGTGDTKAGSAVPAPPRQPQPAQRDATPADPWATVPGRAEAETPALAPTVAAAPSPVPPVAAATPTPQPSAFAAGVANPYQAQPPHATPHQALAYQASQPQAAAYQPSQPHRSGPYQDPQPTAPYPAAPYQPVPAYPMVKKKRRRWPAVLTGLVAVVVVAAGAVLFIPGLVPPGLLPTGLPFGAGATATPTAEKTEPYVRTNRPAWLPADFVQVVDDESTPMFLGGAANPAGTCTYLSPGFLEVSRSGRGVTACRSSEALKAIIVTDAAAEAQLRVRSGCAGLWMRTGAKGYFVTVCADGTANLYLLHDTDPDEQNRLRQWRTAFDPENVVVGILAERDELTVYLDGKAQPTVTDPTISAGKLTVGGFGPRDEGIDAIVTQYRAWRLP